jgi:Outer membrane lipoprotein-sorting protein
MKTVLSSLFLAAALISPASAQKPAAPAATEGLSAEAIVSMVHRSRALNDYDLNGELTKGKSVVPFSIKLKDSLIHFKFENPRQHINLDITEKGYRLKEVSAGSNKEVPAAMYATGIRGTDMTYDDISMRYLYWPKKVKIGEETLKTRRCYVVDLYNPQKLGEYYLVRIFVDKESGGLMRLNAYDWNGKLIKTCAVTAGMKVDGVTLMKTMEVIRYVPGTSKAAGETTFELKKPQKN